MQYLLIWEPSTAENLGMPLFPLIHADSLPFCHSRSISRSKSSKLNVDLHPEPSELPQLLKLWFGGCTSANKETVPRAVWSGKRVSMEFSGMSLECSVLTFCTSLIIMYTYTSLTVSLLIQPNNIFLPVCLLLFFVQFNKKKIPDAKKFFYYNTLLNLCTQMSDKNKLSDAPFRLS